MSKRWRDMTAQAPVSSTAGAGRSAVSYATVVGTSRRCFGSQIQINQIVYCFQSISSDLPALLLCPGDAET